MFHSSSHDCDCGRDNLFLGKYEAFFVALGVGGINNVGVWIVLSDLAEVYVKEKVALENGIKRIEVELELCDDDSQGLKKVEDMIREFMTVLQTIVEEEAITSRE